MFLDNDDTLTVNRSIISAANAINDNINNLNTFNVTLEEHFEGTQSDPNNFTSIVIPERRIKNYYENTVLNFSDEAYEAIFKMKKSTVQVIYT